MKFTASVACGRLYPAELGISRSTVDVTRVSSARYIYIYLSPGQVLLQMVELPAVLQPVMMKFVYCRGIRYQVVRMVT